MIQTGKYGVTSLLLVLWMGIIQPAAAQTVSFTERIFVHLDRNYYLAGEKVWFTVYCLDAVSRKPSPISSMATLELFDPDARAMVRQKVKLDRGMGSGCLTLPSACESGPYLLRTYTAWQRNEGPDAYSYSQLLIIDPSRPLMRQAEGNAPGGSGNFFSAEGQDSSDQLRVELSGLRSSYAPHDTVRFDLHLFTPSGEPTSARLSVSACRSGTYLTGLRSNSMARQMLPGERFREDPDTVRFLPEMDGQLVTGTVVDRSGGAPLPGRKLLLSFVDTVPSLYTGTTDASGRFFINTDQQYGEKEMVVQLYPQDPEARIVLEDAFPRDPLPDLDLSIPDSADLRSLYSELLLNQQINRAYGLEHAISVPSEIPALQVFGTYDQQIVMEDYIRLPVMEEVFRELGKRVMLIREGNGYNVRLLDQQTNRIIGDAPLFFLDGVPFTDGGVLLQLDPLRLQEIRFKSTRYFVRNLIMDGIIALNSVAGDAPLPEQPGSMVRARYRGLPALEYQFEPSARALGNNHVPLVMNTLFFSPQYRYSKGIPNTLQWIAPDSKGTYDIIVKVLDAEGNMGEFSRSFRVE